MRAALALALLASVVSPCLAGCGGGAHARASEARTQSRNNAITIERLEKRIEALEKRLEAAEGR